MNRVCVVVWLSWVWLSLVLSALTAWAQGIPVVINEVLYDPAGSDGGYEFVELFNQADAAIGLEGWIFETGNGSYQARWKLEWTGSRMDTIGPRGFFVIGEEGVLPGPDAVTALDLQNGPDGCRLTDPVGGTDVVGWGSLGFEEYFEGEPAADTPRHGFRRSILSARSQMRGPKPAGMGRSSQHGLADAVTARLSWRTSIPPRPSVWCCGSPIRERDTTRSWHGLRIVTTGGTGTTRCSPRS